MDYLSIHDNIINRAKNRIYSEGYESHHILPKCEGGSQNSEQVFLTQKEHRIVHKLRYKITGVIGNFLAYNLMRYGREKMSEMIKEISILGGRAHHSSYKLRDYDSYIQRQKIAGINGGNKCKKSKIGFFNLSPEEMSEARKKGREKIVTEKIGMFSEEYREKHKLMLYKKIKTPDGIFNSMKSAAEFYNVVPGTITYRVKSDSWKEWFYINGGEINYE